MEILSGTKLQRIAEKDSRLFQGLLPELVKRLIISSCPDISNIRIPGKDDVWAPGFDGVVESNQENRFVCAGKSVWEFGTSNGTLKKINKDYNNRTKNPLGIDKASTEFYLVTPYIWAYDNQGQSITRWESDRSLDWKKVHVYDANKIADWTNSEPAVCAWLLEQLGEGDDIDFSTVSKAWDKFSKKTDPSLCMELFTEGRDKEKADFIACIGKPRIKVKAFTSLDAYGFCLASLLADSNLVETVIVVNNEKTYKDLSRFCTGETFLLNFPLNIDVIEGNGAITCYNREDTGIKADVELTQQSKSFFEAAIEKMNLPKEEARKLYRQTHGNMLALIRRIPGNSYESSPKWAKLDDIQLLAPLLLLQNFDTQNECDRNLIAYLANTEYETVFRKYNAWSHLEDCPVKFVENHIVLSSFEEAWEVLAIDTRSPVFNRLIEAIKTLAFSRDGIIDDTHRIADYNSGSHLRNMILCLVYFSYDSENKECIDRAISSLVSHEPLSRNLLDQLSLLSEAAPLVVMGFLKNDLGAKDGFIAESFEAERYSNSSDKIIWALDELVLHEETKVNACDTLFELSRKYGGKALGNSNTPRESLIRALCLWSDYTLFSIEEKEKLINRYLNEDPSFMISFVVDLLLKDNIFYGVSEWKKVKPNTTVLVRDLCDVRNRLGKRAFKECIERKDIECLKKLLMGYRHFYACTLIEAAGIFKAADYDSDTLIPLNYDLRHSIFFARSDEETAQWIPALETWVKCTTPEGELGPIGWMFYDYYDYRFDRLLEENNGLDLEELSKKRNEKRIEVLKESAAVISEEKPVQFIHFSKDDFAWGSFYAKQVNGNTLQIMAKEAHALNKIRLVSGMLDEAELDDCICFLKSLPCADQEKVLGYINRQDIIDWLDTEGKRKAFWANKTMRKYDEVSYRELLRYNPYGLLPYYSYISKAPICDEFDRIIAIFESVAAFVAEEETRYHRQSALYELSEIIKKVEAEGLDNEKWTAACSNLHDMDLLETYPETLKEYYFNNPQLLCDRVSQNSKYYYEFWYEYKLPECAYTDKKAFEHFVHTLIDNNTESRPTLSILGGILGRSKSDPDGIFPHEHVRRAMDEYRDLNLSRYVLMGELNARGSRWVGDGSEAKAYAEKCFANERRFAVDYPETAALWRMMGEDYLAEGRHDHVISEIGLL
ncbi:MAG: hypothetical protein II897_07140 [Clostridia bacterium]|nr:hypothetical protein [Clostridia bacterium]